MHIVGNAKKHLIVIGGGAAGFFCAVNAARLDPFLKVTLLEKTSKLLSKVKVSGGGRCNVTHACFEIAEIIKKYPRGENFLKKTFHEFFTTDTIHWFEERGVMLKTEPDGRIFPVTDSSQTVIDCLIHEANKYHVEIVMNAGVKTVKKDGKTFTIEMPGTRILTSDYVCVASGGYPKEEMFAWLRETGHHIEEPVPSLFTFNIPGHTITRLMGVAVPDARIKIGGSKLAERGPVLITHWGLSGPAILRLSAWGARELAACGWQFGVVINWLPVSSESSLREHFQEFRNGFASQKILARSQFGLPQRLWQFLGEQSGILAAMRWADLPAKVQNQFIRNLANYELAIKGKTTYKEEFVTAGGILLSEISATTMQSKIVAGLYFAGEVMNVDGITGGFNFQHAWTSGWVAANAIAKGSGD